CLGGAFWAGGPGGRSPAPGYRVLIADQPESERIQTITRRLRNPPMPHDLLRLTPVAANPHAAATKPGSRTTQQETRGRTSLAISSIWRRSSPTGQQLTRWQPARA